jgi:copper chaperone CopZ
MMALQTASKAIETTERARFCVEAHCPRCAVTLEQALSTTDGVRRARVHPITGDTILDYDPALIRPNDLQEAIEAAGFDAKLLGTGPEAPVVYRYRGQWAGERWLSQREI